jgi:hypothetical protein
LYGNAAARESLANKAALFVQDTATLNKISGIDTLSVDSASLRDQKVIVERLDKDVKTLKNLHTEIKASGIPVGWTRDDLRISKFRDIIKKIGGLLLTAFAVSMGAPFWFDVLSKLSNLRSSGNKPITMAEEKTEK